jgi:hypothetical protein
MVIRAKRGHLLATAPQILPSAAYLQLTMTSVSCVFAALQVVHFEPFGWPSAKNSMHCRLLLR